ncbi:MAG TPA: alpha/beta hydrolase [Burkholderiales bacterium]|nr:alpha/beta hydrolase [Burkholderiales bacterium]
MKPHPQVEKLLEAASRSPLPLYHTVPAFVARRIYHDTRGALAPKRPEVAQVRLLVTPDKVALRSYRPIVDEVLPALVFFHGGGWTIGDLDTHDVLCRQLAAGARCAVFSVDYRLGPESPFPAAVEDSVSSTDYVFQNAEKLQIDPARIAVGGDSAGGNLAAVVSIALKEKVAFQLLIYPATDQRGVHPSHERNGRGYLLTTDSMNYFRGSYLPRQADWTDWRASPLLAPSLKGVAPAFVLTAGFDPLQDEGREYAERLKREGVQAEHRDYPDMIHGFIVMGGVLDTANAAVADCCAALRRAFEKVTA